MVIALFPPTYSILRLAWAFWAARIEEVLESATDMIDLNQMVDTIEKTKGIKFAKGFNPSVECIRLAFDPVVASHRPLIYYAVSSVVFSFFRRGSLILPQKPQSTDPTIRCQRNVLL